MYKFMFIALTLLLINKNALAHSDARDVAMFHTLFTHWTDAFNRKDLAQSCALFAKNVVADYRGYPERNYSSICDGFKKIFREANYRYHYRFKLHSVYRSENLAAVRITWYLSLYENGKKISESQDEGMDVFEKNKLGKWQIINYLSYPV